MEFLFLSLEREGVLVTHGIHHPRQHRLVGIEHLLRMFLGDAQCAIKPHFGLGADLAVPVHADHRVNHHRQHDAQDGEQAQ